MSRTSKIHAAHSGPSSISVTIADPRLPRDLTTPEQADADQALALAKQSVRRVGKTIEQRAADGTWSLKQAYRFVNEAKRANRPFVAAKSH